MQAEEAPRCGDRAAQFIERNARGVGREQGFGLHRRLGRAVQRFLGRGILEDRLDHEIGVGGALALDVGDEPRHGGFDPFRGLQPLHEQLVRTVERGLDVLHLAILQGHVEATQRAPRRDVATHDACANDVHATHVRRHALAEALQATLQEEHAQEVPARRRRGELHDRPCFEFQALADRGTASPPHLDQRERCRIVFGPRLGRGLPAHDRREDLAYRPQIRGPGAQALRERSPCRVTHALLGAFDQLVGFRGRIDDADRFCCPRGQAAPGEHQVQRLRCADQARQSRGAAPARMDAELDLGQADLRRRVIACDALATGKREFRAAAEALTVDRCDGRAAQARQLLEHVLAALDRIRHRTRARESGELVEIGAECEIIAIRPQHDPARRVEGKAFDDLAEFLDDLAAQSVDRRVGAREGQDEDRIGVGLGLPVPETETFEHAWLRARKGKRL